MVLRLFRASLVAQMVKRLPAVRETQVPSLGWEDTLEKEMATHSSTLAWNISRTEESGRLQSMGLQRVRHDWETSHFLTNYKNLCCCYILLGSFHKQTGIIRNVYWFCSWNLKSVNFIEVYPHPLKDKKH